jgi:hypothetical protein
MSGGQDNDCGTPQGGVISPLLANLYMNRFLKHWRATGKGEMFRARIVSYADDFVILSCGHAAEALVWTKAVMMRLGLTLNEAVRPASLLEEWSAVSGCKPVAQERATDQRQGRSHSGSRQQGCLARSV